jgi:hypothetical protein
MADNNLTLAQSIAKVGVLSIEAGALARDLDALMKLEKDAARNGVLHRLRGALLEFNLHATHALARMSEVSRHSASRKLHEVVEALKIISADAAADDINKSALDAAVEKVGAVRKAVAAI